MVRTPKFGLAKKSEIVFFFCLLSSYEFLGYFTLFVVSKSLHICYVIGDVFACPASLWFRLKLRENNPVKSN